jgi:dCTP deaminase
MSSFIRAQIIRRIRPQIITPFHERTEHNGLTFGLGPAGYDVRIAQSVMGWDGKFTLASTIERFDIPHNVLAQVCDKSSWARRGVFVQNTIIEPGWRGYLTLELTFHRAVDIKAGDPIAQIIFLELSEPTTLPYQGKYQDQSEGPQEAK